MNKILLMLSFAFSSLCLSTLGQAEIYKQVDANGHVTYSNVPIKGAIKLDLEPPASSNGNAGTSNREGRTKTATPANFPRVDKQTQNQRDDKRKQILQDELEAEKKALEDAKKAYAEGESVPEVYRAANGKTFRNVAKFDEKMQRLQADVDAHESNVQLLQKELDSIK
jgi:hypothetical protein